MKNEQVGIIAGGAVAVVLGIQILKSRVFGKGSKYDGLDSAVSYSSRKIAAARAMEAEEENPLVLDPLAAQLAGSKALADSRRRQQPAPADSGRKNKVNMITIRTKWFDDQIECSLGMPVGPIIDKPDYIAATCLAGQAPRQCVLLGAGMDSRAWRLKLPASCKWFEVDRADVLAAKDASLINAGAEIEVLSPMSRSQSVNTLLANKIGTIDHHTVAVRHPLRAYSREAVIADLGDAAWKQDLLKAGFDPSKPTVWIAEGLLMYLTPERAPQLIKEVAELSAPGSALIAVSVTEEVITDITTNGGKSELMRSWAFGCPPDVKSWLAGLGWKAEAVATRVSMAKALGIESEMCAFDTDELKSNRSLFFAASVAQ